jgi:mRNA interferase MazF
MRRGDVVWVDFEPIRGVEANKRRPAVVVSNEAANRTTQRLGRGVLTVVPITSNTERIYPFQVLLPADRCDLRQDSKAQAEQLRSVTVERVGAVIATLPTDLVDELDEALRLHLAL